MDGKEGESDADSIFCCACAKKVRKGARYCWNCNNDQSTNGPPDWDKESSATTTSSQATSFGRPQSHKRKAMSFESYVKAKTSEKQAACEFRTKKKAVKKDDNAEVTINIGLKRFDEEDLKTIRGKRLPVSVPQNASYSTILEKAVSKWGAFDRRFEADKEYVLLYEDGTEAVFMPGETKEFFSLKQYKTEVGKDFKRLVFYLCDKDQFSAYETYLNEPVSTIEEDWSSHDEDVIASSQQIESDESIARKLQQELNSEAAFQDIVDDPNPQSPTTTVIVDGDNEQINNYRDVVQELASKVKHSAQFFIATRRKAPFSRIISLWQRQASKSHPTNLLRVHYSGESGIDNGAIALEFLERCIQDMGLAMFPNGAPVESSYHVQNGSFRTCGEIAAVSLAQGGPPPCFLEQCSYESAFKEIDMMNIGDENLTATENRLIEEVRSDCQKYTDLILDNGYTGAIKEENIEAMIRSLKVSFVSRRCLYMKEFMLGLSTYNLDQMIIKKPLLCQPLFVIGELKIVVTPDADYLFSLLEPHYSRVGTSRRCFEEDIMDFFQDALHDYETGNLTGHTAAVASNYEEELEINDAENVDQEGNEVFESPNLSVPGVMGWLTGSQHKPISGEKFKIPVYFDHDCLKNKPGHTVCFPVISACAKSITFPVEHLKSTESFRELFTLAYCKGQSFGQP